MAGVVVTWAHPRLTAKLHEVGGRRVVGVRDLVQLRRATGDPSCRAAFVSDDRLSDIDEPLGVPVVALMDERLSDAIALLARHPWLSHVYNLAFLESARGGQHLAFLLECFAEGPGPIDLFGFVGNRFEARMARLSRASQKRERLARIEEFFHTRGVGSRTLETARDVSEELLTNAFYDAPAAARVPGRTMSRIHDVALPRNRSCEIVYGMRGDLVFVRVRDSFGSLTRERLVSVLRRCALAKMQVALDDGAGGAGLGLWRIFARASFVVVVVRPGHESEFLVGIARRAPSKAPTRPVGINLFFISPVPDHRAGIVDLPLDRSVPFLEQGGRTR